MAEVFDSFSWPNDSPVLHPNCPATKSWKPRLQAKPSLAMGLGLGPGLPGRLRDCSPGCPLDAFTSLSGCLSASVCLGGDVASCTDLLYKDHVRIYNDLQCNVTCSKDTRRDRSILDTGQEIRSKLLTYSLRISSPVAGVRRCFVSGRSAEICWRSILARCRTLT